MDAMKFVTVSLPLLSLLLTACRVNEPEPAPEPEPEIIEQVFYSTREDVARTRAIADVLYEAKLAFDDNRLMRPVSNSAYKWYTRALTMDPGNEVALAGLDEIVNRYISLANNATRIGQLDEAETYLQRAAMIKDEGEALRQARLALEEVRKRGVNTYPLDPDALSERNLDIMMEQLRDIVGQLQQENATFLITARSDEEGRWIYSAMREAAGGRLRGNIVLGDVPGIQVNLPNSE